MASDSAWQHARLVLAVILGALTLVAGVRANEPAMMTIGAGLIGFSPAAKGPAAPEAPKLVVAK